MIAVNDVLTGISVISTLCAIVFGYVAFSRNRRMDNQQEGEKNASLFMEISYMKGMIDEMKRKMALQEERHIECSNQLAKVEANVDKALARIDMLGTTLLGNKKEGID